MSTGCESARTHEAKATFWQTIFRFGKSSVNSILMIGPISVVDVRALSTSWYPRSARFRKPVGLEVLGCVHFRGVRLLARLIVLCIISPISDRTTIPRSFQFFLRHISFWFAGFRPLFRQRQRFPRRDASQVPDPQTIVAVPATPMCGRRGASCSKTSSVGEHQPYDPSKLDAKVNVVPSIALHPECQAIVRPQSHTFLAREF
jgi:hypothetical protein